MITCDLELARIFKDHVARFFGDHDRWCVGVTGNYRRHDGGIDNAHPVYPPNPETIIDHRHLVTPHFAGTCRMINRL